MLKIIKKLLGVTNDQLSKIEQSSTFPAQQSLADLRIRMMSDKEYFAEKNNLSQERQSSQASEKSIRTIYQSSNEDSAVSSAPTHFPKNTTQAPSQNKPTDEKQASSPDLDLKLNSMVETAQYFYEVIKKSLMDEKGLHAETAIIASGRLAGSLLYRSVPQETNEKYKSEGTMVLSNQVDAERKSLELIMDATLSTYGVTQDEQAIRLLMASNTPHQMLGRSKLSFLGTMEKIQPFCLSFCEVTDDYRQAALAAMMTAATFIRDSATVMNQNEAIAMAMYGVIEGTKTVPPLGGTKDEKLHALKPSNPISIYKNEAEKVYELVKEFLNEKDNIDLPSLYCALAALAGQACLQCALARYQPVEPLKSAEAILSEGSLLAVRTSDGQELFFGNLLNQPLYESKYSVWNLTHAYLKQLHPQLNLDVNEIFDYVAKSVGGHSFGVPRVPANHMPKQLPIFYLKQLWFKTSEILTNITDKKQEWPYIMASAILTAINENKQNRHNPDYLLIARLIMESAIPMSKVAIEENIVLGSYIVNKKSPD